MFQIARITTGRAAARLLTFVLIVAQQAQLPAATSPARAATPAQTVPPAPPAPVESTPAPQPAVPPDSEMADAGIPPHQDQPALLTQVLLLPASSDPNQDVLWRYFHPFGWVKQGLPATGWSWLGIAASPLNPDHWLLWGDKGSGLSVSGTQQLLVNGTSSSSPL